MRLEPDFGASIFRCGFVKILANTKVLAAFCASPTEKYFATKFCDLKRADFCMIFGEAEHIRLSPMCDNEPKSTENLPFQAGPSFNALARLKRKKLPINDNSGKSQDLYSCVLLYPFA